MGRQKKEKTFAALKIPNGLGSLEIKKNNNNALNAA